MLMTVRDLNRSQLNELKSAYFWGDETQDVLPDNVARPDQIPDEIIFDHYEGICFVPDDFSSCVEEDPLQKLKAVNILWDTDGCQPPTR